MCVSLYKIISFTNTANTFKHLFKTRPLFLKGYDIEFGLLFIYNDLLQNKNPLKHEYRYELIILFNQQVSNLNHLARLCYSINKKISIISKDETLYLLKIRKLITNFSFIYTLFLDDSLIGSSLLNNSKMANKIIKMIESMINIDKNYNHILDQLRFIKHSSNRHHKSSNSSNTAFYNSINNDNDDIDQLLLESSSAHVDNDDADQLLFESTSAHVNDNEVDQLLFESTSVHFNN